MELLKKLNYIFAKKQKVQVAVLFFIIVGGALWELLGITAIMPFVNVAMDPQSIFESDLLAFFYEVFHMTSSNMFLAFLAGVLILIYIVKNLYLTAMNYGIYRFSYNNQRRISEKLLSSYLKQPYTFFLQKNSAELIRNISEDVSMLMDTVLSTMQLVAEFLVCGLLLIYLLFKDKTITLVVGAVLLLFLFLIMRSIKKNIRLRGQNVREAREGITKWLFQTFGGIKETKLLEREDFFRKRYSEHSTKFAYNHGIYQTLSYIPKPAMETVCIVSLMGVIAIKLLRGVDSEYFISTVSIFAVAAFRLLPAFNRITGYMSRIMFNHYGVNSVYHDLKEVEELEQKLKIRECLVEKLPFEREIEIKNIFFHYPNVEENVLENVSLTIPKNKSVAFVGPSGAGKTTLADIILSVLTPQKGAVLVDGENIEHNLKHWHSKLGYIPQSIYLIDDTIRNNISYGIEEEEINEERIWDVIKEAQLKEFVESLEDGLDTYIGEGGVRLSGGQRQRIGIARALYGDPEILILDEATSALDTDTETAVMDAINSLAGKKTLIIIAHRLSTIENCDIVYEIKEHEVIVKKN